MPKPLIRQNPDLRFMINTGLEDLARLLLSIPDMTRRLSPAEKELRLQRHLYRVKRNNELPYSIRNDIGVRMFKKVKQQSGKSYQFTGDMIFLGSLYETLGPDVIAHLREENLFSDGKERRQAIEDDQKSAKKYGWRQT